MKHLTVCTLALVSVLTFFSVSGCIKGSQAPGLGQSSSHNIADQDLTLNQDNDSQASYYVITSYSIHYTKLYDIKNKEQQHLQ